MKYKEEQVAISNCLSDILKDKNTKVLYFEDRSRRKLIETSQEFNYNPDILSNSISDVVVWVSDATLENGIKQIGQYFSEFVEHEIFGVVRQLRPESTSNLNFRDFLSNHLIRAAVIQTPESVAKQLIDWKYNGKMTYRVNYYIGKLKIESKLIIDEHTSVLPGTDNNFDKNVERITKFETDQAWAGIIVSMKSMVSPVFHKPKHEKDLYNFGNEQTKPQELEPYFNDALEYAFSLTLNEFIPVTLGGIHGKEITAFSGVNVHHIIDVESVVQKDVDLDVLNQVFHCLPGLQILFEQNQRFRTGTGRWLQSKKVSQENRFIELRIALVALFLDKKQPLINRTLASNISKYFANENIEFENVSELSKEFYDSASTIIHGSNFQGSVVSERLLANMQDICRLAILRMVENSSIPEWQSYS